MKPLLGLVSLAFVALLLRSTALSVLDSRGVTIDVLAFATLLWALRYQESWGATFGFVIGLAADVDTAHWLGRHALVLTLIGYVAGRLGRTLVRDSARTQFVLLFVATLIHESWVLLFQLGGVAGWRFLLTRAILAAVVTAPFGTLVIALMRRGSGRPLFGHAAIEPGQAP